MQLSDKDKYRQKVKEEGKKQFQPGTGVSCL
jgi:hypothetical protein